MHVITPHQAAITVFNRHGLVRKYASKTEALAHLGYRWISNNVGLNFREYIQRNRVFIPDAAQQFQHDIVYRDHAFILRDDNGVCLVAGDFHELAMDIYRTRRKVSRYDRFRFWNGSGPVPGTRHYRGGHIFRRPGTHPLRRDAVHFPDAGEPGIRAKRSANNLPTSYDDCHRSDVGGRSWKRYRKTQWKD